ncbi:MAG TPA: hypothetical protein PLQ56_23220 [Aggregatilineales bacterium]|nr:hypothetical protein [Aggregatilineales bacterium]
MIDERTASPIVKQMLALAQNLTTAEKVQFMEQMFADLSTTIVQPVPKPAIVTESGGLTWGQQVLAALDALDLSEFQSPEFDDPVKWVEEQRARRRQERNLDWGDEE